VALVPHQLGHDQLDEISASIVAIQSIIVGFFIAMR
jgi:hypothetical protein